LIVSLFGSTDIPTTLGVDPVATADTMAAWVKKFKLDGVDVDYEVSGVNTALFFLDYHSFCKDFGAIDAGNGKAEVRGLCLNTPMHQHAANSYRRHGWWPLQNDSAVVCL
jgi:hypothetical protein